MTTATAAEGNTMEIRYLGRTRYLTQLCESVKTFLLGCGYPNSLYSPAAAKAGYNISINLNDNGMYGFMYIYGIVGVIVVIVLMIRMFKMSYKIFKRTDNTVFLMYMILHVCMSYNIIGWYWWNDGTFILILMLCILEYLTKEGIGTSWKEENRI
jgi:hypothetical protein